MEDAAQWETAAFDPNDTGNGVLPITSFPSDDEPELEDAAPPPGPREAEVRAGGICAVWAVAALPPPPVPPGALWWLERRCGCGGRRALVSAEVAAGAAAPGLGGGSELLLTAPCPVPLEAVGLEEVAFEVGKVGGGGGGGLAAGAACRSGTIWSLKSCSRRSG